MRYHSLLSVGQVSHLKDVCTDTTETTIMVNVDEICEITEPPQWLPAVCLPNLVRIYPFNDARSVQLLFDSTVYCASYSTLERACYYCALAAETGQLEKV